MGLIKTSSLRAIPFSRQIPSQEHSCDQGCVWFFHDGSEWIMDLWSLYEGDTYRDDRGDGYWLPHWALPIPSEQ